MDKFLETEMITSIATIILVIVCIAVFIKYGGHAAFYILAAVTLIVGFANAWLIAKGEKAERTKHRAAAPERKRKRGR